MKSNIKKVLSIILIVLLISIFISFIVIYFVDKALADSILDSVIKFVNQPLPIIGVTAGAILLFIWKVIVTTNYGKKKLEQYDAKQKELEQEYEKFVNAADGKINDLINENSALREQLSHACLLSSNKKIKDFGKELNSYGKGTNSDTEEE